MGWTERVDCGASKEGVFECVISLHLLGIKNVLKKGSQYRLILLFIILQPFRTNIVFAEKPYTPPKGSIERKAILDALRKDCPVNEIVFIVNHLKVKDGWAWIETNPQSPDGRNKFEPLNALLHKEKGKWIIKNVQPCCGECADDPECADIKRYYKKLMREFPTAPKDIFPE